MNLIHYVALQAERKRKDLLNFGRNMNALEAATKYLSIQPSSHTYLYSNYIIIIFINNLLSFTELRSSN